VQVAIRHATTNPQVGIVLVGFASLDQLEEAAGASNGETLTADDLVRFEELNRSDLGLRTVA
jgi:aryl-alcohol dehydrogenase-like predicted oxidoreductase